MQSLAASKNDYSDFSEEEEEEEEANPEVAEVQKIDEDQKTEESSRSNTNWLNNAPSHEMQKYGIGAKLMYQMGYKEGQGLGLKNTGIVNPIETKLRPQGLGVGGVNEKVKQDVDIKMDSSDEEVEVEAVQTVSLFEIIQQLEAKNVKVPLTFKQLSDNSENTSDVLEAYQRLSLINKKLVDLQQQEAFITYQLADVKRKLEKDDEVATEANEVLTLLTADATDDKLDKLVTLKNASAFVSLIQPKLKILFHDHFIEDRNKLLDKLIEWSFKYKEMGIVGDSIGFGYFDSLVYLMFSEHFHKLLHSKEMDAPHTDKLLSIIQDWLDSPIFINHDLISTKISRDHIIPFFELFDGNKTFLIDYILLLSPQEIGPFKGLLVLIYGSFLVYVQELDLHWNSRSRSVVSALREMSNIWFKVFERYLTNEGEILTLAIRTSLIKFLGAILFKDKNFGLAVDVFELKLINFEDVKLICQFQILNPWIKYIQGLPSDSLRQNVYAWNKFWKKKVYGELTPLVEWYTNTLIMYLNGEQIKLPTLFGDILPSSELVERVIAQGLPGNVNVNGIPAYQLSSTFKDVVMEFCNLSHVLFRKVPGKYHPTKGYPLNEIAFDSGKKVWSYIHEDILWVSSDSEKVFKPIHLEDLLLYR